MQPPAQFLFSSRSEIYSPTFTGPALLTQLLSLEPVDDYLLPIPAIDPQEDLEDVSYTPERSLIRSSVTISLSIAQTRQIVELKLEASKLAF